MKPVDLYKLNPAHDEVISVRSDIKLRSLPENACCSRIRSIEEIGLPDLGIYHTRVNFCWICGRRLR